MGLTPLVVIVISVSFWVYSDIVNGREIPNWSSLSGVFTRVVGLESSRSYVVAEVEDEFDGANRVVDGEVGVLREGAAESKDEVEEVGDG